MWPQSFLGIWDFPFKSKKGKTSITERYDQICIDWENAFNELFEILQELKKDNSKLREDIRLRDEIIHSQKLHIDMLKAKVGGDDDL